jgi:hypothetical protein
LFRFRRQFFRPPRQELVGQHFSAHRQIFEVGPDRIGDAGKTDHDEHANEGKFQLPLALLGGLCLRLESVFAPAARGNVFLVPRLKNCRKVGSLAQRSLRRFQSVGRMREPSRIPAVRRPVARGALDAFQHGEKA